MGIAGKVAIVFTSKPHHEGVVGVAKHINKLWEPRKRRQFFKIIDAGEADMHPLVIEAAAKVRPPGPEENPI